MINVNEPDVLKALKTLPHVFSLFYKNDKKYLFIMLLEVFSFSIDKYPSLLVMKYTIDSLTNNISYNEYVRTIIPLIVVMLVLKMIRVQLNTSRPCRDQVITENLFNALFAQCMRIDYQTLESKEMQDKKELAKYIANGKIAAIGWYFVETFSSLIAIIIASIFILKINAIVLVVVVSGVLVRIFFVKKNVDKIAPITEQQVIDKRYISYLYEIGSDYEYAKEFRIFCYKEKLYEKIKEAKCKYISTNDKVMKYNLLFLSIQNIEDFLIKLAAFSITGFSCLKSFIAISDFTFAIGLINDYISYSNSFASSCKRYIEAAAYIEYYIEFMKYKSILSLPKESKKNVSVAPHVIEFQNVYFKYPQNKEYALRNINLKLCAPMKISLVGRNGAGKSTLIKLLLRLYKPDEGKIMINGVDIFEIPSEEYSGLFSSVFQDFVLFAFPISENISSFDKIINQQFFLDVSRETGVADFICCYPERYETYFTNAYSKNGVDFSGGQQQKIALARSIYKDSAIFFILDEPMSTYDADAEYQFYQKYEKILFGKLSIFISHRLSSCKLSDYIILLDRGMVVEEGSHSKLMENDTQYKRMFELQANQYNWEADKNNE